MSTMLPPRGFRMPAEWEPHRATWIAWPHNKTDWPGKFSPIPWVYVEIVRHLHRSERVCILVEDGKSEKTATRLLAQAGVDLSQVDFFCFPTDRGWTRDSGPIFIKQDGEEKSEVALTNWRFNAWARYPDWKNDNQIPQRIARRRKLPQYKPTARRGRGEVRVVLEGGSIDVNGEGTLLTTEGCLLSPIQQRNPGLNRGDLEKLFEEYLGVTKIIWLKNGIAGDDTHGHVDDLARFVRRDTVLAATESNALDENFVHLKENLAILKNSVDQDGHPLKVVPLPMPRPLYYDGQRLPASYVNFYIATKTVLVPTFNDPADREALGLLARFFPDRDVVGIHAVDLVLGQGTLHCLTQQEPC